MPEIALCPERRGNTMERMEPIYRRSGSASLPMARMGLQGQDVRDACYVRQSIHTLRDSRLSSRQSNTQRLNRLIVPSAGSTALPMLVRDCRDYYASGWSRAQRVAHVSYIATATTLELDCPGSGVEGQQQGSRARQKRVAQRNEMHLRARRSGCFGLDPGAVSLAFSGLLACTCGEGPAGEISPAAYRSLSPQACLASPINGT